MEVWSGCMKKSIAAQVVGAFFLHPSRKQGERVGEERKNSRKICLGKKGREWELWPNLESKRRRRRRRRKRKARNQLWTANNKEKDGISLYTGRNRKLFFCLTHNFWDWSVKTPTEC